MPVVIVGVGNELAGDDGIGIAALRALRERPDLPAGVELLEIGTLGLAALSAIEPQAVVVEPARIEPLERNLSPEAAGALPRLLDRVILEVRRLLDPSPPGSAGESTARR